MQMIEESDIPDHWDYEELGDIADFQNGNDFSKDQWEKDGQPIIRIQNLTGTGESFNYYSGEVDDRYRVSNGDVLFAWSGTIDAFRWDGGDAWLNQHIYNVRPNSEMDKDFLYWLLKQVSGVLEQKKVGGTLQHIRKSHVTNFKAPVPPLDEQERIVAAVEERLNAVDALEQSVQRVDELSSEYEDSLLAFLLAGKDDFSRGDIDGLPSQENIKEEWELKELGDVVEYHSNLTDPSKNPEKEYNLVELNDVEQNARGISNVQTKKGEDIGSNKREFNDNHVLYCKLRPYLNKVVMPEFSGIASSELLVFEPKEEISREYLYQYLSSPMVCNKAEFLMKGANHPRISKKELMKFNIAVPPKDKREDVVEKMKMIRESELDKSLRNIDPLFEEYRESILSHAFRGKIEF